MSKVQEFLETLLKQDIWMFKGHRELTLGAIAAGLLFGGYTTFVTKDTAFMNRTLVEKEEDGKFQTVREVVTIETMRSICYPAVFMGAAAWCMPVYPAFVILDALVPKKKTEEKKIIKKIKLTLEMSPSNGSVKSLMTMLSFPHV